MAKSIVYKHYQRLLTQWPVDLLRPEVSFQKAIQRRIDTRLKPSTTAPEDNVVFNQAQATVPTKVAFDEKGELEQVNVLYSFLENRYTKTYPLSEKMMRPASNPNYYDGLLKELNEAPTRSWFQSMVIRWKGSLRFS
ncbi:hypothetical protein HO173_006288 [Letharia columbiana]|uniref:Uncharacterized protein n=1 Tax=Letharia columbiana TaxID=112416 RepID=A0A8H6FVM6_9LECA|nr:uncharacterized protein HO173_006288 [Letharia columbiana]KAF6235605.1 hypothetical protein HO173_006288 [Letharia columbiana]